MNSVIGFALGIICYWLAFISTRSIKAHNANRKIKVPSHPRPLPKSETLKSVYTTEKLYKVRLSSDLGTANLENIVSVKKGENFITFTNKDGKEFNYKNEHISSYIIGETGSYKRELKYKVVDGPRGTSIKFL